MSANPLDVIRTAATRFWIWSRQEGNPAALRGYWGDIVSSPYLAFGVETDDKSLLQKQNGQHIKVKSAFIVAEGLFFNS